MSKQEISLRISVETPAPGIIMKVQRGKSELLEPVKNTKAELVFEFPVTADISGPAPNFLGKYTQGPKDQRFVYVNSGQSAGQMDTDIVRRAKISLMSITKDQVSLVAAEPQRILETSFPGTDKHGKPTCASVKGIEWKIVER